MGRGVAALLSPGNEILLGSRDPARSRKTAEDLSRILGGSVRGGSNEEIAERCELAILCIPDPSESGLLERLQEPLRAKIVVSPIVPMRFESGLFIYSKLSWSAAEDVAGVLRGSRVVAALHHLPALTIQRRARSVNFDVLVACDERIDFEEFAEFLKAATDLRPLYAGPLKSARILESLTPLLINCGKLNKLGSLSLRLVS